jgi:MFS family permease
LLLSYYIINIGVKMQKSTFILKVVVMLLGLFVLGICVFGLPYAIITDRTDGYRPILIGMYVSAIPFFIALYQAVKLLDFIDKNHAFSIASIRALKNIKQCGYAISAFYAAGMPYIYYVADKDDAPGVVLVGCIIVGAAFVVGTASAVFQKLVQSAVDLKLENDLTI